MKPHPSWVAWSTRRPRLRAHHRALRRHRKDHHAIDARLSARAPYFANGSAKTLREVVEVYNRRYNIRLSEQEIDDLTNLMSVL